MTERLAAKERHELVREIAKVNFHGVLTIDYFERIIDTVLASEFLMPALGFEKFDEDGMSEQWERRKTARA